MLKRMNKKGAAAILKLLVLSICLNTFLYLGVNYAMNTAIPADQRPDLQDDLFTIMLDDRAEFKSSMDDYMNNINSSGNATFGYKFAPSGNFSSPPEQRSSVTNIGLVASSFIDIIKMVVPFIITLWRIATISLTLFQYNLFPPTVALIIGLPLFLLNLVTVAVLLRGGGAT